VDLANKPSEFVDLYHSIVTDRAAKEHVPLLVDGQTRLVDATIIAEYLARQYAAEGAPLVPPDPASQAMVSLFIRFFQDTVVPPFLHLLHVEGAAAEEEARAALMEALAALDDFLALHGGYQGDRALGPHYSWSMHEEEGRDTGLQSACYFMGPYYSLAEVVCTPWVARMVEVLPEWRSMDVMVECDKAHLSKARDWMAACLARPSAAATCPAKEQLVEGLAAREWSRAT
jgi:glutathione S-transferase